MGEFFEQCRPSTAQAGDAAVFEESTVEHVRDPQVPLGGAEAAKCVVDGVHR